MDNPSLERYSRQILVPGFDLEAQERLERARIVLVGCGGLGVPLAGLIHGGWLRHCVARRRRFFWL